MRAVVVGIAAFLIVGALFWAAERTLGALMPDLLRFLDSPWARLLLPASTVLVALGCGVAGYRHSRRGPGA